MTGPEVADLALGLDDVALDRRARRIGTGHVLGEERGIVLLGAVEAGAGVEDQLAHGRDGTRAGGEDVHRADDVVLVRQPRARHDRVDDQSRVDHRVDRRRVDDPADQGVAVGDLDELGAQSRASFGGGGRSR